MLLCPVYLPHWLPLGFRIHPAFSPLCSLAHAFSFAWAHSLPCTLIVKFYSSFCVGNLPLWSLVWFPRQMNGSLFYMSSVPGSYLSYGTILIWWWEFQVFLLSLTGSPWRTRNFVLFVIVLQTLIVAHCCLWSKSFWKPIDFVRIIWQRSQGDLEWNTLRPALHSQGSCSVIPKTLCRSAHIFLKSFEWHSRFCGCH